MKNVKLGMKKIKTIIAMFLVLILSSQTVYAATETNESIIDYVSAKEIESRIDARTRNEFSNIIKGDSELLKFYNSSTTQQINQINSEADEFKINKENIDGISPEFNKVEVANIENNLEIDKLELNNIQTRQLNIASASSLAANLGQLNSELIAIGVPASLRYGLLAQAASIVAALADGPLPFGDIAAIAVGIGVGFIIISNWDVIEANGTEILDTLRKVYYNVSYELFLKVQYGISESLELIENAAEERGRNLPLTDKPNSVRERVKDGKVVQRRHYDGNGRAKVDEDFSDHGTPNLHSNPHYHEWDWSSGTPKRGKTINWFD